MLGGMADSTGASIAQALGVILQRDFRSGLYRQVTADLHDALDSATYPVLSGVDRYGPTSAAALGQRVGLDRSVVSRRAARLVAGGLLRQEPDPADARAALLALTGAGEAVVAQMRQRLASAIDEHLDTWSATDRRTFATLLERFAAARPGT
jgi:DNA-binding MarR family transcriptional regulator